MPDARGFSFLLFSDLHYNKDISFNSTQALDRLIDFLSLRNFPCDYIFIAGDIANKCDYTGTKSYISRLCGAVNLPMNKGQRVYWAVGNHDIKRGRTQREQAIEMIRNSKMPRPPDIFEQTMNDEESRMLLTQTGMREYLDAYEDICGCKYPQEEILNAHRYFELHELNLFVLNTCITSCDTNDSQNLFISEKRLHVLLNSARPDTPTIVLGHHGREFFHPDEQIRLRGLFENRVDMYLCGHSHHPSYESFDTHPHEVHQITCGGGIIDGYSKFVFMYGEYDTQEKKLSITPYSYAESGIKNWAEDFRLHSMLSNDNHAFSFTRIDKGTAGARQSGNVAEDLLSETVVALEPDVTESKKELAKNNKPIKKKPDISHESVIIVFSILIAILVIVGIMHSSEPTPGTETGSDQPAWQEPLDTEPEQDASKESSDTYSTPIQNEKSTLNEKTVQNEDSMLDVSPEQDEDLALNDMPMINGDTSDNDSILKNNSESSLIEYSHMVPFSETGYYAELSTAPPVDKRSGTFSDAFSFLTFLRAPNGETARIFENYMEISSLEEIREAKLTAGGVLRDGFLHVFMVNNGWGESAEVPIDVKFSEGGGGIYIEPDQLFSDNKVTDRVSLRSGDIQKIAEFSIDEEKFDQYLKSKQLSELLYEIMVVVVINNQTEVIGQIMGRPGEYFLDTGDGGDGGDGEEGNVSIFLPLDIDDTEAGSKLSFNTREAQSQFSNTMRIETTVAPNKSCAISFKFGYNINGNPNETSTYSATVTVPVYFKDAINSTGGSIYVWMYENNINAITIRELRARGLSTYIYNNKSINVNAKGELSD